jgi:translation initiation factor 5B
MIRQPIISVLGHVDHGKTTILDSIRGTLVQKREAGGITQHIGATEVPTETIRSICKDLMEKMKLELTIPGLLFIDTPGHEAFTSLRKRGGNIADLAVLVVDINEGIMPQTKESIEIMKSNKVPFVVAANKVDLIPGWRGNKCFCLADSLKKQGATAKKELEDRMYKLMNQLSMEGFDSESYERADFEKQVAIIPVSGKFGEGIAELLVVLSGLAQKYLEKNLKIEVSGPGRGNVLEIKEEPGLGKTIDVILYDGSISTGDRIAIGAIPKPIVTKVKAILKPSPLRELREKGKFERLKSVHAAAGVKISCQNQEGVVAGMPLLVVEGGEADEIDELKKDIETVLFKRDKDGVVVKADSIGGLEGMLSILKKRDIPVKRADVGDINKEDITEAKSISDKNRFLGVIFGFNVKENPQARELAEDHKIRVFISDIIYRIIDDYEEWKEGEEKRQKLEELKGVCMPAKISILPGFVFHQSKPAVVGIEVLEGKITNGLKLMDLDGVGIGQIKDIQDSGLRLEEAGKGERVAVSVEGGFVGKNMREGDVLVSDFSETDFRKLSKHREILSKEDKEIIREILEIKRKKEPLWGIN